MQYIWLYILTIIQSIARSLLIVHKENIFEKPACSYKIIFLLVISSSFTSIYSNEQAHSEACAHSMTISLLLYATNNDSVYGVV